MSDLILSLPAWPLYVVVVAMLLAAVALHGYGTAGPMENDP